MLFLAARDPNGEPSWGGANLLTGGAAPQILRMVVKLVRGERGRLLPDVTRMGLVAFDNKFLEALVKIEDEDTFNEPMYMAKRWRRDPNVWRESICAENSIDYFDANFVPIPQAKQPDF